MRNFLERISIKGTENRREAILKILDELGLPYQLQEIERKTYDYTKYLTPTPSSYKSILKDYEKEYNSLYAEILADPLSAEPLSEREFELEEESLSFDEELANSWFLYEMGDIADESDYLNYKDTFSEKVYEEEKETDNYLSHYSGTQKSYNIIVTLSDSFYESDNKILLGAHYDVVFGSTGANDNGSSISILLKLAKTIKEQNIDLPIQIVFFDGEETGGIGSSNYINEYLPSDEEKDKLTLINLDVCGCGDHIVVVDNILNIENNAYLLLSDEIVKKHKIVEADRFPFSDATIFKNKNVGVLSISVFPQADVDILYGKTESAETSKENILTRKHFGSYVWDYMHNGKYDDISYINYDMMEAVYNYILECLV